MAKKLKSLQIFVVGDFSIVYLNCNKCKRKPTGIVLPIYDFVNYLSLFRCCATEINACCLDALMSHKVSE